MRTSEIQGMAPNITSISVRDIRFPTSLEAHGSDAMNDPDYSCVYVMLHTDTAYQGHGLTFTIGKGNDIVCAAVNAMKYLVVGKDLRDIVVNFGGYYRTLVSDGQLRWLGPEKGVMHLATCAILNAVWDLWAKTEGKPVWKLLSDMEPEKLVSAIDFRHISDFLTKEEALEILKKGQINKEKREKEMKEKGYPAYTTSAGWLGYTDQVIEKRCKAALEDGFTKFKVKVGADLQDDVRRCANVRKHIGDDKLMMTDANQRWDVQQAIDWMIELSQFNIHWIEEPTSPDDVLGHAAISKALKPYGIGVATGEMCQNRVMFKQFLQAGAMQFCQIDSCRMGSINEILAVMLMAAKAGVPVCPHAGGVGLCELVQHLAIFDYICISGSLENRVVEYVDHLHEHFIDPVVMKNGHYQAPKVAGYSVEMKKASLDAYEFPGGSEWQKMFDQGIYQRPT